MPPSRLLLFVVCAVIALTCLVALSISLNSGLNPRDFERKWFSRYNLRPLFNFQSPVSLFVPSATISLTDDNSTFFVATPAAFGPPLPTRGLSGELWIGSGFGDEYFDRKRLELGFEGELGCSDVHNWPERDPNSDLQFFSTAEQMPSIESSPSTDVERLRLTGKETSDIPETHDADTQQLSQRIDRTTYKTLSVRGSYSSNSQRTWKKDSSHPSRANLFQRIDEISGKVVLLSRGGCGFSEKVNWAQRRGAIAVIIGDNRSGPLVRMYARGDTSNITIPSIFTSYTSAEILSSLIPNRPIIGPLSRTMPRCLGDTSFGSNSIRRDEYSVENNGDRPKYDSPTFRSLSQNGKVESNHGVLMFGWLKDLLRREMSAFDNSRLESVDKYSKRRQRVALEEADGLFIDCEKEPGEHSGLRVTLTPTDMNGSPFFHTLFVLVVSPLLTLIIVYSMLLLRSRIRRRRWRAPKSVVERLPVRIYHTFSSSSSSTTLDATTQGPSTSTTPLLAGSRSDFSDLQSRSCRDYESQSSKHFNAPEDALHDLSDSEKSDNGLSVFRSTCKVKQRECVVCLEEYMNGVSRVMSLPCGHEFHVECITPWLTTRRRTCPICKGDVVRSMRRRAAAEAATTTKSTRSNQESCDTSNEDDECEALVVGEEPTSAALVRGLPSNVRNSPASMPLQHNSGGRYFESSSQWISRHFNRGLDFVRRYSWSERNATDHQQDSSPRQRQQSSH